MKRLLVFGIAIATLVLILPGAAQAHVFIKDSLAGAGAVLHVTPDDDPVAGEPASLFFDIQNQSLSKAPWAASLTITSSDGSQTHVPIMQHGSTVAADYTFPAQGLYDVRLVVSQNQRSLHNFNTSVRVSRGVFGSSVTDTPRWAELGLLATIVGGMVLVIVAYNRRISIAKYSK